MSRAAETARQFLLRQRADQAVERATRLGAELERVWDSGGEPSEEQVVTFGSACAEAERLLLEWAVSGPEAQEPAVREPER